MSHFSVIVIGGNVEAQLAPFHEFECTGENDKYVQDIDITEEVQADINEHGFARGLDYSYGLSGRIVSDESELDLSDTHMYAYAIVKDGKLVKAVKRTNPNAQWDWWVVGGRWSGFFKMKEGGTSDSACKGDIDLEGMQDERASNAAAYWDRLRTGVDGDWTTWEEVMAKHKNTDGGTDFEKAREEYWGQPQLMTIESRLTKDEGFWFSPESVRCTRDEYIARERGAAITAYAIVEDSQWNAKGEMGWFGMSSDSMTQDEWNAKVSEILLGLPDDTRLTIVDCHI